MAIQISKRGVLVKSGRRWVQLNVGRGATDHRVAWRPRQGQISLRTVGSWWVGLYWSRQPANRDRA